MQSGKKPNATKRKPQYSNGILTKGDFFRAASKISSKAGRFYAKQWNEALR